MRNVWFSILLILVVSPVRSPGLQDSPPPPLRLQAPFDSVWDGMNSLLQEKGFQIIRKDRGRGELATDFQQYISGPLTGRHIGKIGETPRLTDGEWQEVRYQYEIRLLLVTQTETVLTVDANIEALARPFLGGERRLRIQTNGRLEEKLMEEFGRSIFGEGFSLQRPKKGFWEREPTYLPDPGTQNPPIAGPERQP